MDGPVDKSLEEVTVPCVFTFVPDVQKLPIKSCLEKTSGSSKTKRHENMVKETTREAMSKKQLFSAVYIPNCEEREAGSSSQSQSNTHTGAALCDLASGCAPILSDRSVNTSLSMEAAANKHRDVSQQHYQRVPGRAPEPHKIKSSYKSLAAIPTNTLLLDQQAIDEQVERAEDITRDRGVPLDATETDTHNEMCSPAWLRKESEELYAVIDEILANSVSSTSKPPSVREPQKNSSTFPRACGRETKYASVCSLYSNGNHKTQGDLMKTKPGVIRSVTAASRPTAQDHNKKSEHSPFRQFVVSQQLSDSTKGENTCDSKKQSEGECSGGPSACDLHITEPEEHVQHLPKHGLPLGASSFLSC